MPTPERLFLSLAALLGLAACMGGELPQTRKSPPVARGSTEPVRFDGLSLGSMRRGMVTGRYVWALECWPPYEDVYWTSGRSLHENSTFQERFAEVLADAGYDVAGVQGSDYEAEFDRKRARFVLRGDLRAVNSDLCRRRSWLTGGGEGVSGVGSLRVDWAVYDAVTGRLVHRVTTTGVARKDSGVPQGDVLLIEEAFGTAVEALGADPGFRAAVSRGGAIASSGPAIVSSGRGGVSTTPPGASSAGPVVSSGVAGVSSAAPDVSTGPSVVSTVAIETVTVDPGGASAGPAPVLEDTRPPTLILRIVDPLQGYADDPTARVSAATVRVGPEERKGRGIVLGELDGQSLVLTLDAGLDATVTVAPSRGVSLDGMVMARDRSGGIALVRVPARLHAAPLRLDDPAVSEPVTAVLERGDDTASGILAARRADPQAAPGVEATLFQADLTGPDAAPGDPLVDEAGNLLGVARPGPLPSGAHGLTVFVPVMEALARLGVEVTQLAPRPTPSHGPIPSRGMPAHDARLDGNRRPPT
ncbi:trypsin-like peptidase domain-containing protein [Azospirillum brasilense]|nr:trypsin-like peptidase domain-containing protein [Azospirillum brasilense]